RWCPSPPAAVLPAWAWELTGRRALPRVPVALQLAGPVPRARAPEVPQPALAGRQARVWAGGRVRAQFAIPFRPSSGASRRELWQWCPSPLAAGLLAQASPLFVRRAGARVAVRSQARVARLAAGAERRAGTSIAPEAQVARRAAAVGRQAPAQ